MACIQSRRYDKPFYDRWTYSDDFFPTVWRLYKDTAFAVAEKEMTRRLTGNRCRLIDLGAGAGWMSLVASRLPQVAEVHCFDISARRMRQYIPVTNGYVKGDTGKLTLVEGDFNEPLPYRDNVFDAAIFDASMHHSRRIWETLGEAYRVLKPGGYVFATRESILSIFYRREIAELREKTEPKFRVSENSYLREQYEYYLKLAEFQDIKYVPVYMNRKQRLLRFFNGWLFNNWVIIARKPVTPPALDIDRFWRLAREQSK